MGFMTLEQDPADAEYPWKFKLQRASVKREIRRTTLNVCESQFRVPLTDQVKLELLGGSVAIEAIFPADISAKQRNDKISYLRRIVAGSTQFKSRDITLQEAQITAPWNGHISQGPQDMDLEARGNPMFYMLRFPSFDSPEANKSNNEDAGDERCRGTFASSFDNAFVHIGATRDLRGERFLDIHDEDMCVQPFMESTSCVNADGTPYQKHIRPRELRLRHGAKNGVFWRSEEAHMRKMTIHLQEMTCEFALRHYGFGTIFACNRNGNRSFEYMGDFYRTVKCAVHPCVWHVAFRRLGREQCEELWGKFQGYCNPVVVFIQGLPASRKERFLWLEEKLVSLRKVGAINPERVDDEDNLVKEILTLQEAATTTIMQHVAKDTLYNYTTAPASIEQEDIDFVWNFMETIIEHYVHTKLSNQFPPDDRKEEEMYFGYPLLVTTSPPNDDEQVSGVMTFMLYARVHNVFLETANICEPRILYTHREDMVNLLNQELWSKALATEDEDVLESLLEKLGVRFPEQQRVAASSSSSTAAVDTPTIMPSQSIQEGDPFA
jgi:hypothetical protein